MSKFLSIIENVISEYDLSSENEVLKDIDKKKKNNIPLSDQEKEIDNLNNQVLKKTKDKLTKQLATEDEDEEVAQEPSDAESPVDVLSPEGEVFYVDQMKKALFVDLDNIDLTSSEREMVTHDVTPQNAKQVAEIIQKIIKDFGL